MSELYKLQNLEDNIDLLAAAKVLYSDAKKIQSLRWLIALAIGIGGTMFLLHPESKTDFKPYLALFGVFWTILDQFVFSLAEQKKRLKGAQVQEQFDTTVYGLQWNEDVAGTRVSPEEISCLSRRYGASRRDKLKDWYPDTRSVSNLKSIVICQRVNAVWNRRLTSFFASFLFVFSVLICFGVAVFGMLEELAAFPFVGLFSIWSSFIVMNFKLSSNVSESSKKSQSLEEKIFQTWDSLNKNSSEVDIEKLRRIQNDLFRNRSSQVSSPDFLQSLLRDQYHKDAAYAVDKLLGSSRESESENLK